MDVTARIYSTQWKEYRRRHLRAVIGLLVGLPLAFLVAAPFIFLFGFPVEIPLIISVLIWGGVWAPLAFHVIRFPCPRCGKQLQSNNGCDNCRLLLYEGA